MIRPIAIRPARAVIALATVIGPILACSASPSHTAGTSIGVSTGTVSDTMWHTLFDGTSTDAWRGYRQQTLPAGWRVVGATLTKAGVVDDILTRDEYGDFELTLDWMLSPAGNSGVFYRATEEYEKVYWSGPEYQLLDDAGHPDGRSRLTAAGAAYGLYPSPPGIVKPAGEWNATRIVARGAHIEHWMNGQKVVEYELWSPDWEAKVQASKFREWPHYGRARRGHIGIQGDHEGTLTVRNVRIRTLAP